MILLLILSLLVSCGETNNTTQSTQQEANNPPPSLPESPPVLVDQSVGRQSAVRFTVPDRSCSGVLVAKDLILTAAHCLLNSGNTPYAAGTLKVVKFFDDQEREVKTFTVNDKFPIERSADVALIQLKSDAPANAQLVRILQRRYVHDREQVYIFSNAANKLVATLAIEPSDARVIGTETKGSLEANRLLGIAREQTVIINPYGAQSVNGDFGGPLYVQDNDKWYAVGISSELSDRYFKSPKTTNYVAIGAFIDWIRSKSSSSVPLYYEANLDFIQNFATTSPENARIFQLRKECFPEVTSVGGLENQTLLTATYNGNIVGFFTYRLQKSGTLLYVHDVCVSSSIRGVSIGTQMLELGLPTLENISSVNTLELDVLKTNIAAIRLYESVGFKNVGDSTRYPDGQFFGMRKILTK